MERYGRIAVPGAVIGLVLSVLVGLIAGVGLGTVILRGVISAVAMGAGSAGLYAAAERLLPGLTEEEGAAGGNDVRDDDGTNDETEVPAPGGQLNIVVEDESDESGGFAEAEGAAETGYDSRDAEDESASDASPSEAEPVDAEPLEVEPADAEPLDAPPAEELPAEPQRAEVQNAPPPVGEDDEAEDDLVEEIEEQSADDAEAIMNQAIAEEKYGSGVEIDDSVLDEMPDIGSFSGSFGSNDESDDADDSGGGFSAQPSGGSGRQNAGGATGNGNDPAQIAKALKTMLSRDGKE